MLKKWKNRSFATDLIFKGLGALFMFVIILLLFNFLISGNIYASDFWTMISGVITTIAAFIAIIVFARRAIIEGYYLSTLDYAMATFYAELENNKDLSQMYNSIKNRYNQKGDIPKKEWEELQEYYCYLCFKNYIDNMNSIEKLIICLYSYFTIADFSTHLELSRAARKEWFENSHNDFI